MRGAALAAFLTVLLAAGARAQDGKLMGGASLFLGQYFFNGGAGSVNGYGDLNLQYARSFSSQQGFFVNEHSVYTGFKQVNELAGGGTLFQQSLDNSLGAKWIRRFEGGWSLKPRAGVRSELFRETNDEKWGSGLYDFWRYEAGLALERKTRLGLSTPWTYQISYDFYYTNYTHFKSLANQFGSELAAPDPGAKVLDTFTHQFSYRSDFDFPGFMSASFLYSLSMVSFLDQRVVNSQGQYFDARRSDAVQTVSLGLGKRLLDIQAMGRVRPVVGGGLTFTNLISNQNHFDTDPSRLKYIGSYYNYSEIRAAPTLGMTFLTLMVNAHLGYEFGYREYSGRLTQLSNGSYTSDRLHQTSHSVFIDASYPIRRNLDFKVRGLWNVSSSNTQYQQTYTYDYHTANYFAGIEWKL